MPATSSLPHRGASPAPATSRSNPALRRELALLIALGLALRLLWMILAHAWTEPVDLGEATNEAMAFARSGTIGDPYFVGQGPSAHLLPTMVVIAGTILRLLGPDGAAANVALALWALAQVAAGFVLTAMLFARLGASRAALLAGIGVLCLLPAPIASEAADFRVWEGALAYDLAAANLVWIAMLRDRKQVSERDLAMAAAAWAACFFVSPPAGVGAGAAWTLFAMTRLAWRRAAAFAGLALAMLAIPMVPWTLRNQAALGHPVPLRSNLGLELAIANHPGALDPASPRAAYEGHTAAVHQTEARFRAVGGEVAWSARVGGRAERWIAAHPLAFARLTLRHYRQFYVPDTWLEDATNWTGANRLRIRMLQLVGALGLVGLGVGLWRRRPGYGAIAAYVMVAGLPYALVQPIPRYSYIVYPLLALLATRLVAEPLAGAGRAR